MHSPKAIANSFLELSGKTKQSLTQMKLHKLIYYAHGWNLGIVGRPLINEMIEAWKFGPVIRSLYYEFRDVGAAPIDRRATEAEVEPRTNEIRFVAPAVAAEDVGTTALLDRIWKIYGHLTAAQLSQMTHEPGAPWDTIWKKAQEDGVIRGRDIPNELIQEYFRRKAEANRAARGNPAGP
jgi:uncharacterized phage-associated protein